MSKGKTNSGTGGGSGKSSIIVTAPTGSVVYIENQDGKRKDAGEKNGTWTFKGCDIGTWTVNATLGEQNATQTVEIKEEGQMMRYEVTIDYGLYLYSPGDEHEDLTGGFVPAKLGYSNWTRYTPTVTRGSEALTFTVNVKTGSWISGGMYTAKKIDFTNYSSLKINAGVTPGRVDVSITDTVGADTKVTDIAFISITPSSIGDVTFDVSSISGNHYVAFILTNSGISSSYPTATLYKCYLV